MYSIVSSVLFFFISDIGLLILLAVDVDCLFDTAVSADNVILLILIFYDYI